MKRITKNALVVATALTCVAAALALGACSDDSAAQDDSTTTDQGSVAAVLAGTNIYENDVTTQIERLRNSYGVTDDYYWALFLMFNGMTSETLRENIIENMTYNQVLLQAASDEGVTVSDDEVDEAVAKMKASYNLSDEEWETTLQQSGYTDDSYRSAVANSLLGSALYEKITGGDSVSREYFEENGMTYVKAYFSSAKRSSHILFAAEDETTAADVLAKLQSGELAFADAAAQYSIDTGSAADGGDVGWDGVHSFVTEYQNALDGLEKGQMSDLVVSEYGIHIILCTDTFTYTDETTVDDVPSDIYDYVVDNYLKPLLWSDYISGVRDSMGFEVNPMPEGLSYDIDISKVLEEAAQSADDSDSSSDDSSDTDATATDDSAAGEADSTDTDSTNAEGGTTADNETTSAAGAAESTSEQAETSSANATSTQQESTTATAGQEKQAA